MLAIAETKMANAPINITMERNENAAARGGKAARAALEPFLAKLRARDEAAAREAGEREARDERDGRAHLR